MKYSLTLSLSFFLVVCGMSRAQSNTPTTYSFQQLQYGPAYTINDRGQVLLLGDSFGDSCLFDPIGTYTLFGLSSAVFAQFATAVGMNNLDQFVGTSFHGDDANGRYFLYQNGTDSSQGNADRVTFADGNYGSLPVAVNDADLILGQQTNGPPPFYTRTYVLKSLLSEEVTTVSYPGTTVTVAAGLNDAGTVVGHYLDAKGIAHGFVYQGGRYSTLDVPQTKSTQLTGINNIGDIVGNYVGLLGVTRGFVYSSGKFTTINLPSNLAPLGLINLVGLNDEGQIVGNAGTTPFVATPGYFTGF